MKRFILILSCVFMFSSCQFLFYLDDIFGYLNEYSEENYKDEDDTKEDESLNEEEPASTEDEIRLKALEYAKMYCEADTKYVSGGQDFIRVIKVDCSGMVINCYEYAVKKSIYKLPFSDATANNIYTQYSTHTNNPKPGDLIFLDYSSGAGIDHIGIFVKQEAGKIYFIDATEDYNVSQRSYSSTDSKIVGFGKMDLIYR